MNDVRFVLLARGNHFHKWRCAWSVMLGGSQLTRGGSKSTRVLARQAVLLEQFAQSPSFLARDLGRVGDITLGLFHKFRQIMPVKLFECLRFCC